MVNPKILGFALTVLLFISIIGALGGPIIPGGDEDPREIVPDGGVFTTTDWTVPIIDITIGIPDPSNLLATIGNMVGIYDSILKEGGPILQGITILMLLIITYEVGTVLLEILNDVIPLT